MDQARRAAGLSDFSPRQGSTRALHAFLRAIEDDTTPSDAALGRLHHQVRQRLVSRLEVED